MSYIVPDKVERIRAAHENYVAALRAYNSLRCAKPRRGGDPAYAKQVSDAQRRVKAVFVAWATLSKHEA